MEIKTSYRGSETTEKMVRAQLEERYGPEVAQGYNPYENVATLKDWNRHGYRVKKGEKALRSITMVEKKDEKGEVVKRYPKRCFLFHISQCERVGE
jgi:hypothetical protein